jgi:CotH kinase protein/Chitobiase/beta-hexosaminidase C-terminal domain/Secretion system C-terminal sorting domain/Lamin Tail Domain
MWYYKLIGVLFFLPASLLGQVSLPDTLPLADTVFYHSSTLKSSSELTFESIPDTTITIVFNELLAMNSGLTVDNAGDDDDWFEIYNYGDDPVRLNTLFFTDDPSEPFKWKLDTLEEIMLEPEKHLLIWADGEPEEGFNHAPFKLSGDGETLALYSGDGSLIDHISFGPQTSNVSYGRYPDAGLIWNFFAYPTPGADNTLPGSLTVLPVPTSNLTGGIYPEPVILALFSNIPGATIVYTTDCSEPGDSDLEYQEPIKIDTTSIIRARLIMDGAINGPVLTISVILDENLYENPVVSLVAEPEALYGSTGIISANNSYVEVTADMEYIEDGETRYRGGAGITLHAPKGIMPNSLRLSARSRYGAGWFDYAFFQEKGPEKFKRLILRNSGNDNVNKATTNTHFRDPLLQTIAGKSNKTPMISESKPVNVFLNGSYHGLFNMREREDEYYIETHTGVTENYTLIELAFGYYGNINTIAGSYSEWTKLLSFVDTTGDLSLDADFRIAEELVDLDNFTDYWITEVFAGNYDWLSNNIKFWKPDDGKWKWLYWDTDHGLGLKYSNYGEVTWNTLVWSLTNSDRAWSNGYNNILIRNLLKNEAYKETFIKRFTQMLSTSLSFEYTKPLLDSIRNLYENDMLIHTGHWGRSMSNWENACHIVENYLNERPDVVLIHLRDYFELQDPVPVSIRVEPPGAGTVSFSGLEISSIPMQGKFFPGFSYQFQYEPLSGFNLEKLEPFDGQGNSFEFLLSDTLDIVAYCLPSDHSFPIQLSEVYFNKRELYDVGNWIEFYYYGAEPLNLHGWYITGNDDQTFYTFGENSFVNPGEHFLLVEDLDKFRNVYPESINCFGNLYQGFAGQTMLSLKSDEGETIKMVDLMNSSDWPLFPEEGYSLELKSLVKNANIGTSWKLSKNSFGSPGLLNHAFYNFREPTGKDTILTSFETHMLKFVSSGDFYLDPDNHSMAGISIKAITGPGQFYMAETRIEEGQVYPPGDLVFKPREPHNSPCSLVYSFFDKSGQESADYSILFSPIADVIEQTQENFQVYPVPAQDFCTIVIPSNHQGPIELYLFDMNGKMLQSLHSKTNPRTLSINLSTIESGMYFYLIRTWNSVVNGKLEVIK